MADLIQFFCPICGASLKVPATMAGTMGPCPCCRRDIVAPGPALGMGGFRQASRAPVPPREPEFRPFMEPVAVSPTTSRVEETTDAGSPPPVSGPKHDPAPAPPTADGVPRDPPVINVSCPKSPQRAILVLSVLLTAVLALLTGYIAGARSNWLVSRITPPVINHPRTATPEPGPPEPLTKTVIVRPPVEPPAQAPEDDKTAPVKASAAAEAALKAFLAAPDWTTRSAYVMNPEKVRTAMEIHSRKGPDGPTEWQSVSLENSHTDTLSGNTTFIFKVVTAERPTGIPVAVLETPSGWQVDWETFIEFRDDLFKRFAEGPSEQTGRFHLIVNTPPPERAARTENEHFVSFLIEAPFPERQMLAYVRKGAPAQSALSTATTAGAPCTPVLELEKKTSPDGKTYLEILSIQADNWLPETR